jgi:tetratricopeptide (TPR) repeat protein
VAKIFLSYSRKDCDCAKALAVGLANSGHTVWWDKDISGGAKFATEIEQALGAAEIVIVLWSRDSISSPWVLDEAAEGRDTGRLVPIALDDCKPPLGFRQFQTITGEARPGAALKEVLDAIGERLGAGRHNGRPTELSGGTGTELQSHCDKAEYLAERGRFHSAWQEVELALARDADSAEANRTAAWILYVQGRSRDAIPYYEGATARSKHDHESAAMLISCYRALADEESLNRVAPLAVARAEHAIAGSATNGRAFASGARGLAALGHVERARKWVRKALNVEPGNLAVRYALASTLVSFMDDCDAAMDVLEPFIEAASKPIDAELLERDPDWAGVRQTSGFQKLLGRVRKRVEALAATTAGPHG